MISKVLNAQAKLLWLWRTKLITLLTQALTSSDSDEVDGQEYGRSLDTQGEAEVYLQAYASLLADRREALTAERTLLAAHESKETKIRKTKTAARAEEDGLEANPCLCLYLVKEVLHRQMAGGKCVVPGESMP